MLVRMRPVIAHRNASADGLRGGFEHGLATKRVHVDELHSTQRRRGKHSAGNGVGNVVEFQVEKNARAECRNFFNGSGTCGGKKLVADLEHTDNVGDLLCEFQRAG